MTQQATLILTTQPQESLSALKSAVAQRFNWRILTGGGDDQPRFVIEKYVLYRLVRGWPMHGLYQVIGSFQSNPNGDTTLRYVVSPQPWIPLLSAAIFITPFVVITVYLGTTTSTPNIGGKPLGPLLVGIMLAIIGGYCWYAYRSYQGHLRELSRFMEEFAQRMGAQPKS
jgi:hypothetical protein